MGLDNYILLYAKECLQIQVLTEYNKLILYITTIYAKILRSSPSDLLKIIFFYDL